MKKVGILLVVAAVVAAGFVTYAREFQSLQNLSGEGLFASADTKNLWLRASFAPSLPSVPDFSLGNSGGSNGKTLLFGKIVPVQNTNAAEVVNAQSQTCLNCHGGSFAELQKQTKDYKYGSATVNPHTYVNMSARDMFSPDVHNNKIVPNCTLCHGRNAHATPRPTAAVPRSVDTCFSCHHERTFESCSSCH
jgi:hypothetical protein